MSGDYLRPYGGAAPAGWTKRAANIERLEPHLADNVHCPAGAGAWAYGTRRVLVASTPAAYYPNTAHVLFVAQPVTAGVQRAHIEVEIATGPSGSEIVFAVVPFSVIAYVVTGTPLIETGCSYPLGPTLVPAGTRMTARVSASVATSVIYTEAHVYISGYQTSVPASDATYPLDAHLGHASTPHTITLP